MKPIKAIVTWKAENTYRVVHEDGNVEITHDGTIEGVTVNGVTIYQVGPILGLEIRTVDGLYACDIKESRDYVLRQVETHDGRLIHTE